MKEDFIDEEDIIFHSDKYYESLLIDLRLEQLADRDKNREKNEIFRPTVEKPSNSPFIYLRSKRALRFLQLKVKDSQPARNDETTKREARERARVEFLCKKEAEVIAFSNAASKNIDSQIGMHAFMRKNIERNLEETVLSPLRKNKDNFDKLLKKNKEVLQSRQEMMQILSPREIQNINHLNSEEHQKEIIQKRDEINKEKEERLRGMIIEKAAKMNANIEEHNNRQMLQLKQRRWLMVFLSLKLLKEIEFKVISMREMKNQDIIQWDAAILLQNVWRRKHGIKTIRSPGKSSINDIWNQVKVADSDHVEVYSSRKDAVSLILRFLKDTKVLTAIRRTIKKINHLHYIVRGWKEITRCRVDLLERLMEHCLHPLAIHISIVQSGKGFDLRNLGHHENAQMSIHSKTSWNLKIIKEMQSSEFHATIRRKLFRLKQFLHNFVSNRRVWTENVDIRRRVLRLLLEQKRRLFVGDLIHVDNLNLETKKITVEEVQRFFKGGADPLQSRVVDMNDKFDNWSNLLFTSRFPFRRGTKGDSFKCPIMLLLKLMTPSDILDFYLTFESAVRQRIDIASISMNMSNVSDDDDDDDDEDESFGGISQFSNSFSESRYSSNFKNQGHRKFNHTQRRVSVRKNSSFSDHIPKLSELKSNNERSRGLSTSGTTAVTSTTSRRQSVLGESSKGLDLHRRSSASKVK